MGLRAADQHLTVFVSREAAAFADGTPNTADEIITDTNMALASITYEASDGTHWATVATALGATGGDGLTFTIIYKDLNNDNFRRGPIVATETLHPYTQKAYTAPTLQVDTLQVPATVVAGDQYIIRLAVPNYAEMISQQDEVYFYGNYVAATGDNADAVALGLQLSLKGRLDSLPSPIADVTVSTDTVTVTAVAQTYVRSKFDGKPVYFHLTLANPQDIAQDRTTTVPANPGAGTYNQVAGMEEFYAGYQSDWLNRTADFPGDGNPTFAAEVGATYGSSVFTYRNKNHADGISLDAQRVEVACYFKQ